MQVFYFLGIAFSLYLWFRFYRTLFQVRNFRPNTTHRSLLVALPMLCTAVITVVFLTWSSPDVRSDSEWIALYLLGGVVWLQLGLLLLSLLGVAVREDVVERQNPAAGWVVYGALIGTTFCYAGSNVGSGPGPEVVLFCAVLSTTFLFGFWLLFERIFGLADRITIERDESAGIRAGAWMASLGLIFGAAVAGDWVSVGVTIRDFFHYSWVATLFLLVAVVSEMTFKALQTSGNTRGSMSVALVFVYFAGALTYVAWRGVH